MHSLRLISYNIRYDNPNDGNGRWALRRPTLVQLLQFHQPDIFGLQEATPNQVDDIAHDMSDEYQWVGLPRDENGTAELTPIFYRSDRFALIETKTRWLSETPDIPGSLGWDADAPRTLVGALLAERPYEGKQPQSSPEAVLRVYNTHFDNVGSQALDRSIALVESWLAEGRQRGVEEWVFMGDLNFTPFDRNYKRLCTFAGDAKSCSKQLHYGPEYTYIGPGFCVSEQHGICYDYVFVSPGVKVLRHAVLTDSLHGRYPSDHLPVYAEILLSPVGASRRGT